MVLVGNKSDLERKREVDMNRGSFKFFLIPFLLRSSGMPLCVFCSFFSKTSRGYSIKFLSSHVKFTLLVSLYCII